MADAAIYYNESITEISNYAMFAEARLGSNGDPWGDAEIATGTSPEDAQYSRVTWDGNLDDGFDSGAIAEAFSVALDDESMEAVSENEVNQDMLAFSTSVSGNVACVQIRAMTLAAASVSWSNIEIKFFRDGVLMDSYSSATGISVDETSEAGPVEAEALLNVTPDGSDYDRVEIRGTFQMAYDSTTITPGSLDLAGQFFVYLA